MRCMLHNFSLDLAWRLLKLSDCFDPTPTSVPLCVVQQCSSISSIHNTNSKCSSYTLHPCSVKSFLPPHVGHVRLCTRFSLLFASDKKLGGGLGMRLSTCTTMHVQEKNIHHSPTGGQVQTSRTIYRKRTHVSRTNVKNQCQYSKYWKSSFANARSHFINGNNWDMLLPLWRHCPWHKIRISSSPERTS